MSTAGSPDIVPISSAGTVRASVVTSSWDRMSELEWFGWKTRTVCNNCKSYTWTVTPNSGYRVVGISLIQELRIDEYRDHELQRSTTTKENLFWPAPVDSSGEVILPSSGQYGFQSNYTETATAYHRAVGTDEYVATGNYTVRSYEAKNVRAIFCEDGKYCITAFAVPPEGANYVSVGNTGRNYYFATPGESVKLFVDPLASQGWGFVEWSDGIEGGWRSQTNGPYVTATCDKTYYAHLAYRSIQITVVKSPSNAEGNVYGSGMYYPGERVDFGAYDAEGSGWMFASWDDGSTVGSRTIYASENKTYTAIFIETGYISLACYSGFYDAFWQRSPWTATATTSTGTVTWDDHSNYIGTSQLETRGDSTQLSTQANGNIPPCIELTFKGWYRHDSNTLRTLISTNTSFTYEGGGNISAVWDIKVKCELKYYDPLGYQDSESGIQLTNLLQLPQPEITVGTAESVALTSTGSSYTFDLLWDQTKIYSNPDYYPSIPEGLSGRTQVKIEIDSVKNAENDVSLGALSVICTGLTPSQNKLGVHSYDEYSSTGVVFDNAYSVFSLVEAPSSCSESRIPIKLMYSSGLIVDWSISVSSGRVLSNTLGSEFYCEVLRYQGNTYDIDFMMLAQWLSGGSYRLKLPMSAFRFFSRFNCWLSYHGGGSSDSLSITFKRNGTVATVVRGTGNSLCTDIEDVVSGYSLSDHVDMIMHVGTFWPIRNVSGIILRNDSGVILNDS